MGEVVQGCWPFVQNDERTSVKLRCQKSEAPWLAADAYVAVQ